MLESMLLIFLCFWFLVRNEEKHPCPHEERENVEEFPNLLFLPIFEFSCIAFENLDKFSYYLKNFYYYIVGQFYSDFCIFCDNFFRIIVLLAKVSLRNPKSSIFRLINSSYSSYVFLMKNSFHQIPHSSFLIEELTSLNYLI